MAPTLIPARPGPRQNALSLLSAVLFESPQITVVKRRSQRAPSATDVTVLAATMRDSSRPGWPVIVNLSAAIAAAFPHNHGADRAEGYTLGGLYNNSRTLRLPYGGQYGNRLAEHLSRAIGRTISVTEV